MLPRSTLSIAVSSVLTFCFLNQAAYAQQPAGPPASVTAAASLSPWDDPRLKEWNRLFMAGRRDEVIQEIEKDLAGDQPHFIATYYWYQTLKTQGKIDERLKAIEGLPLENRGQQAVTIFKLYDDGKYRECLERFTEPAAIDDVMALTAVMQCADNVDRSRAEFDFAVEAIRRQPAHFLAAWHLIALPSDNGFHLKDSILEIFTTDARLKNAPVAEFIVDELKNFPRSDGHDRLAAVDRYLAHYPSDRWALRVRATNLFALGRFNAAFESYRAASHVLPPTTNGVSAAKSLIRDQRYLDARKYLSKWHTLTARDGAEAAIRTEENLANAMRLAGEHGRARDILKPYAVFNEQPWWRLADRETVKPLEIPGGALQKWPDDAGLNDEMARLELADRRPREAITYARKSLAADPDRQSRHELLLECLRRAGDDHIDEAYNVWSQAREQFEWPLEAVYGEAMALLRTLDETEELLEVSDRSIDDYPESTYMWGERILSLHKAGETEQAIEAARRSIRIKPTYEYGINRLFDYVKEMDGENAAYDAVKQHRDRYPWIERTWHILADRVPNTEEKSLIWREAIGRNPERAWPWKQLVLEMIFAKRWEDAHREIVSAKQTVDGGTLRRQAMIELYTVFYYSRKLLAEGLSDTELTAALESCDNFESVGPPAGYFSSHSYRPAFLLRRGKLKAAAASVIAESREWPDSGGGWHDAFNNGLARTMGLGTAFSIGYHEVERKPFNGEKISNLAERHLQWGGSPLIAHFLYELMSQVDPKQFADEQVRSAKSLASFGDSILHYQLAYGNSQDIGRSERYLSWHENARRKAQSPQSRVTPRNGAEPTVEIVHPDGRVELRSFHPISGHATRWQIGAAFIEVDYDPLGNHLTRIESSSGQWVSLTYDNGALITDIKSSSGRDLSFQYNEAGKPNRIAVKGSGVITIDYTPDGEIKKVDSDGGPGMTLQVTQQFQGFLGLVNTFKQLGRSSLPDLPYEDEELEQLRTRVAELMPSDDELDGPEGPPLRRYREAQLALAAHLIEHLSDRQSHATSARQLLRELLDLRETDGNSDTWKHAIAVSATELQHQLLLKTRSAGLTTVDLLEVASVVDWLSTVSSSQSDVSEHAKQVLEKYEDKPLALLESSQWLPRSDFAIPGFWQRYSVSRVLPKPLVETARLQCIHVRSNGDVLVGTSRGLCVYRRGFWEWFAVNERRARLDPNLPVDQIGAQSDILSICEGFSGGEDAILYLGTAGGLIQVKDDYSSKSRIRRWLSETDGLPSPRISSLAWNIHGLLVGTPRGLRRMRNDKLQPVAGLADRDIRWMRPAVARDESNVLPHESVLGDRSVDAVPAVSENAVASLPAPLVPSVVVDSPSAQSEGRAGQAALEVTSQLPNHAHSPILIGTDQAVYQAGKTVSQLVAESDIDEMVWNASAGVLTFLKNGTLRRVEWNGTGVAGKSSYLPGQSAIMKSQQIHGLSPLQIDDQHAGILVLTDLGGSVYFDRHFEHLNPPKHLTNREADFREVATSGRRLAVLSSEGVYLFERTRVKGDTRGPAVAIATLDKSGLTYVARGNRLEVYDHELLEERATIVDIGRYTHLAVTPDAHLVFVNGTTVGRISSLAQGAETLFIARQSSIDGLPAAGPEHLTVTSDGTVWVTCGASLLRWRDGMQEPEEFNYYIDPERFPSKTDLVSRVIETVDGKTLVICSDEGHLDHDGVQLTGGVLEWDGQQFQRLDFPEEFDHWFMTSYTPISGDTAIVGSTDGFARHARGQYSSFEDRQDVSYQSLLEQTKQLWLGTDGAQVGEDMWLFGTAGGVVAWNSGRWFYPERLNWLLPDDQLAQYGSRHVHDISTTDEGTIFVATDRGLLIYEVENADSVDFLLFNNRVADALSASQDEQLTEQRRILVDTYLQQHPDSQLAQQWQRIRDKEQEMSRLDEKLRPGKTMQTAEKGRPGPDNVVRGQAREELERQRERIAVDHLRAIEQLKRDFPGAVQLLQVKPLDIRSVRDSLTQQEAIIQYIATPQKLYIHLVTHDQEQLLNVDVPRDQLEERCRNLTQFLARKAYGRASLAVEDSNPADADYDWKNELSWLYEQLLRPVDWDLQDVGHIHIVTPLGPLRYLPFESLIRTNSYTPEYAVGRHSFSYWPDMQFYQFNAKHRGSSDERRYLVMGDPDATLEGARQEAVAVHGRLHSALPLYIGKNASESNFRKHARDCSILHLATHGNLNGKQPEKSFVLFANQKQLTVPEIGALRFKDTRLAVLSACETGLSARGLECATLARAFAHAGAPSVVATLWRVDDAASQSLMEEFYENFSKDKGVAQSLALAKRALTSHKNKEFRNPWMWAGYVNFGKP